MVPNIFYFHPYPEKGLNLTIIFFKWVGSTTTPRHGAKGYKIGASISQGPMGSFLADQLGDLRKMASFKMETRVIFCRVVITPLIGIIAPVKAIYFRPFMGVRL